MHLVGDPAHLLRHFQITDNNYASAWDILRDRYENKRLLVNNHLKRLFAQKIIQQEKAQEIRGLLDTTNECLLAIHNLGVDVSGWEPIVIFITVQKLPSATHQLWEQSMSKDKDIPTWHELEIFLEDRFRALEAVSTRNQLGSHQAKTRPSTRAFHNIRFNKTKRLLINCLNVGHRFANCPSQGRCITCKKAHHSLLHLQQDHNAQLSPQAPSFNPISEVHTHVAQGRSATTTVLATALVRIKAPTGHGVVARALIDPGSQVSFVTEEMAQQLHVTKQGINVQIHGVGGNKLEKSKAQTKLILQSLAGTHEITVTALIFRKVTNTLPDKELEKNNLDGLRGELADPGYFKPSKIDVLLGADCYSYIMLEGLQHRANGRLLAQKTIFGWILCGKGNMASTGTRSIQNFHITTTLDEQLRKFWEIEAVQDTSKLRTAEEALCEQMYEETTILTVTGRYQVSLPFREMTAKSYLGASRNIALRRLYQLENRFIRDDKFKNDYTKVINECIELGHMVEVSNKELNYKIDDVSKYLTCYLPHHGVIKESSTTTKLRVVFDASRATTSGTSLNDMLLKGPVVQDDLVQLFIRWRKYKVAFTADVEKIYRQIWVQDKHAEFQRIVWRTHPNEPVKDYKLLTVTFGTKTAPYLPTRSLQKLAKDEATNYPQASKIALSDFYVDDLLSGADDIETAQQLKEQLTKLMDSGGLPLRKRQSNAIKLTNTIKSEQKLVLPSSEKDDQVKTLGIMWSPEEDCCSYALNLSPIQPTYSKREILSQISKLFDPLGWLT